MAAWGTVFSAFSPNLKIVHRPGRRHSNVDPLSRLPRDPPSQVSPKDPTESTLQPNNDLIQAQENAAWGEPVKWIEVSWAMTEAFMTLGEEAGKEDHETGG